MRPPDAEWQLDTRHIGRRVLVYDSLDSTNTLAASLAQDDTNDGLVVLARQQSAGRGQHGRLWECPPDMGVLLSVLLFPPPALRRPAILTAWAAASTCEAILKITGLQAKIKWPNDIYLFGRKVCGILIEQGRGAVVGIGLNVNQTPEMFATAGLELGVSLRMVSRREWDVAQVAKQLISRLDEEYKHLLAGDWHTLEACWAWRIGLLGKNVVVECVDGWHAGRLVDLTFEGLELDQADQGRLVLQPERIKHLTEANEAGTGLGINF
jgi:BirA family biotin operon repressor/biotin-[acetyl-CoA-carboxylase] ligase